MSGKGSPAGEGGAGRLTPTIIPGRRTTRVFRRICSPTPAASRSSLATKVLYLSWLRQKLVEHYRKTLKAQVLFGSIMTIPSAEARILVDRYFKEP